MDHEEGVQPKTRGLPKRWRRSAIDAINSVHLSYPHTSQYQLPLIDPFLPVQAVMPLRPSGIELATGMHCAAMGRVIVIL